MDFPAAHPSLPMGAVPLSAPRHGVAVHATRLPLSPHCNPFLARNDSLGDFHHSPSVSLASFADQVSRGDRGRLLWPELFAALFPYPPAPRKAGYICTQHLGQNVLPHRLAGSQSASYTGRLTTKGVRLCTTAGLHESRVGSSMPLEGALNPQARHICRAFLQHPPQTGRKKQAPEDSQLCPLKDF